MHFLRTLRHFLSHSCRLHILISVAPDRNRCGARECVMEMRGLCCPRGSFLSPGSLSTVKPQLTPPPRLRHLSLPFRNPALSKSEQHPVLYILHHGLKLTASGIIHYVSETVLKSCKGRVKTSSEMFTPDMFLHKDYLCQFFMLNI